VRHRVLDEEHAELLVDAGDHGHVRRGRVLLLHDDRQPQLHARADARGGPLEAARRELLRLQVAHDADHGAAGVGQLHRGGDGVLVGLDAQVPQHELEDRRPAVVALLRGGGERRQHHALAAAAALDVVEDLAGEAARAVVLVLAPDHAVGVDGIRAASGPVEGARAAEQVPPEAVAAAGVLDDVVHHGERGGPVVRDAGQEQLPPQHDHARIVGRRDRGEHLARPVELPHDVGHAHDAELGAPRRLERSCPLPGRQGLGTPVELEVYACHRVVPDRGGGQGIDGLLGGLAREGVAALLGELARDQRRERGARGGGRHVLAGTGGGHDDAVGRLVDERLRAQLQDERAITQLGLELVQITELADDRARLGGPLRPQKTLSTLQRAQHVVHVPASGTTRLPHEIRG
jgi:hypothetical protein